MSKMPLFTTNFVKAFALELGLTKNDLIVAQRINSTGNPTFALGIHYNGSQFPEWIWTECPLSKSGFGSIRSLCNDALVAKKHLEKHGFAVTLAQPGKLDEGVGEYTIGRRTPVETIRYLAALGRLLPVDARFNRRSVIYVLKEGEDPEQADLKLNMRDAENYIHELRHAFGRLGLSITVNIDVLDISSSSVWEKTWENIWLQINPQL